ncbi:MAG: AraC family transcriptional regulator ligand-binding domain-containing protein [Myxococcales bacterium]|nr:AraC family transcriptional regulator ligand-binding domain-containing protein [Myxococcales bacterium]
MSAAGIQGEMVECCRALVVAAEQAGVRVGPILAEQGIERAALDDPEQRIALDTCDRVWRRLVEASGDPDLFLRAVECSPFGNFLVIDFLGANGTTVGGGVRALARYFHVVHPDLRLEVTREGDAWKLCMGADDPEGAAFALAMTLSRFSGRLEGGLCPLRTTLRRAPARDAALALRLFGPRVAWRAEEDAAWLDDATWTRPLPESNEILGRLMARQAEQLGQPVGRDLPGRVRLALARLLPTGTADLGRVAERLGTSGRSLQRQLAQAGTSFQLILDEERRLAAERHLADPGLTLVEVALLVGYADETAFHRAFQRWHGESPGRWRRSAA